MNYQKIYDDLMTSRKKMSRVKTKDFYFELHHIKPKSLFPELKNDKDNLVLLTIREHYLAHLLLIRITSGEDKYKMICAFRRFCHGKHATKFLNSKEYENAKTLWLKTLKEKLTGVPRPRAVVEKIKATNFERGNFKRTEETKQKLRVAAKKQFETSESREHHSELMKEYYRTHEFTGGVKKGTKYGKYSPERVESVVASLRSYECKETGIKFTGAELAKHLNMCYKTLRKKFETNCEVNINGKHYVKFK